MDPEAPPPPEPASVTIATRDLGRITVRQDQIISFSLGLPGLAECRRYALIELPELAPFLYLQSVDRPDLALAVIDPVKLDLDYRLRVNNGVLKELEVTRVQDLKVLVLLTIPLGRPQEMTANMIAPLLINLKNCWGKQVVLETPRYSHRHRVFPN
jgi:flagellar assembly factor FliW